MGPICENQDRRRLALRRFHFSMVLGLHEERVGLSLCANGGQWAVAGDDHGFVGQGQDRVVQGMQDLLHGTAGQIGAADGAGEESVAGDEFIVGSEVEADAALGVAGRVQDTGAERSCGDCFSGGHGAVDLDFAG